MGSQEATHNLRESVVALCRQGRLRDALNLVDRHRPLAPPDYLTFTSLVQACARARALPEAKLVHTFFLPFLPTYPKETLTIAHNHLIRMYDQCGAPFLAFRVFESMPFHNRVSYNLMMAAHASAGHASQAFRLLIDMHSYHVGLDKFSFISLISACVKSSSLLEGKVSHMLIVFEGLDHVDDIGNALITLYGTCACLDDALRSLHMMPTRSVISWNAIIAVYSQHGHGDIAFQLYAQMQNEGIDPNSVTFLTLLTACATLSKVDEGKKMHALIQASGLHLNVVLCTALVDMYSKCGDFDAALEVSTKMRAGSLACRKTEGSDTTLRLLLETCSSACNLADGELLHACSANGEDDTFLNSLLSMDNGCQSLEEVFSMLSETCIPDTVSWNTLISANSQHGNSNRALDLFRQMLLKGLKPTENTFISVLSVCSHTGLLNEGLLYYCNMFQEFRCVPLAQHNTCMIDLFGRAGQLAEAEAFADKMPLQPGILEWMALASACRVHSFMYQAKWAAHQALELDPLVTGAYIALSNIFSAVCRWDDDAEYD